MIVHATDTRKDFAADTRLLGIAAAAACVGVLSTVAAYALLQLIRLFTNIFFFHYWSTAPNSPAHNTLGREVMTRDVTTIDANTSIAEALDTHFGPHQVHRAFPIVTRSVSGNGRPCHVDETRRILRYCSHQRSIWREFARHGAP